MKIPKAKRALRLGGQFQKVISKLFQFEIAAQFPGSLVTVTEVRVSDDLKHAAIYVSMHAAEGTTQADLQRALAKMSKRIRKTAATEVHIRQIPEFRLVWDDTLDRADRIEQLLNNLNDSQSPSKGVDGEHS